MVCSIPEGRSQSFRNGITFLGSILFVLIFRRGGTFRDNFRAPKLSNPAVDCWGTKSLQVGVYYGLKTLQLGQKSLYCGYRN